VNLSWVQKTEMVFRLRVARLSSLVRKGRANLRDVVKRTLCYPVPKRGHYLDRNSITIHTVVIHRQYGGIHFNQGDQDGRTVGMKVGRQVWAKAQTYFNGTVP
jgi:hypothetical protein